VRLEVAMENGRTEGMEVRDGACRVLQYGQDARRRQLARILIVVWHCGIGGGSTEGRERDVGRRRTGWLVLRMQHVVDATTLHVLGDDEAVAQRVDVDAHQQHDVRMRELAHDRDLAEEVLERLRAIGVQALDCDRCALPKAAIDLGRGADTDARALANVANIDPRNAGELAQQDFGHHDGTLWISVRVAT